MNKRIIWIVLTGGPCAGKTTAIAVIKNKLENQGFRVYLAHEIATFLITSGIHPGDINFQEDVLDLMEVYENILKRNTAKDTTDTVVVLCDRGQMDGMAYVSEIEFRNLLEKRKASMVSLRDHYDAVIFMDSAAVGALEHYTLINNEARYESLEEAVIRNQELKKVWHGHEHLRVIDNSTNFEQKIDRTVASIFQVVGIPIPIEVERKFLVSPKFTSDMIEAHHVKVHIVQHYLETVHEDETGRIRKRGQEGSYAYYYNVKKYLGPGKNDERQRIIPHTEYLAHLEHVDGDYWPLEKDRTCFLFNNQYFELDMFSQIKNRFIPESLLEIELTEAQQHIVLPTFIEPYVIREVTGEETFTNKYLARKKK